MKEEGCADTVWTAPKKILGEITMPPINILIKPASSICNMDCSYCFYRDVAKNRQRYSEGMLSIEKMEDVIKAGMEFAEHVCSFAFQGGEPTLAGLDFYSEVIRIQNKYAKRGIEIRNAIQTNGYIIDDQWAEFLAKNKFLVGISLDGPADIHDRNRKDRNGKGTFNKVMKAIRFMDKYHVEYNILCVVTGQNARAIEKIYRFYRKHGFRWLQFIPCIEDSENSTVEKKWYLSTEGYADFLIRIFDLWYDDLCKGEYVSIRHLDNWFSILMGDRPEACNMSGQCSIQFVIEGDGGVYPCDFYVLDEWRMGTVGKLSFADMCSGEAAKEFIKRSLQVPKRCLECRWRMLCRNGCCRDRLILGDGTVGINKYCSAYRSFFEQRAYKIENALKIIYKMSNFSN